MYSQSAEESALKMSVKAAVPRVLMLSSGVPGGGQNAGAIMLRELCWLYPKGYLSWYGLYGSGSGSSWPTSGVLPDDLGGVPFAVSRIPRECLVNIPERFAKRWPPFRYLKSLSAFTMHRYLRRFIVPRLVEEAVAFGRQQGTEMILAILNGPISIYMATKVASALKIPHITNVQDPPESFVLDLGLDRFTSRVLLKNFSHTLKSSLRCSTASEGMQAEYKRQYGVDSLILNQSANPIQWQPPAQYRQSGEFVIGFAGNLYANQEWSALLKALSSVGWCIGGREIKIRVLSPYLDLRGTNAMRVEYLGWQPVDETLRLLAQTDVTYLPYWFDKDRELSVRQCFPGKLSTYLAAGRPVFYHGPEYASVAQFLQRYPAGYNCYSLDPARILEGVVRLMCDAQYYEDAVQAGQDALCNELGSEIFSGHLAQLFGIDREMLSVQDDKI
jgi:hypothetical protein